MDFVTILSYILAIAETGSLIAALIYFTRAMHEKKNQRKNQGKKGAKSNEIAQKSISASYRYAGIFFFVYLVLNVLRNYSGIFG